MIIHFYVGITKQFLQILRFSNPEMSASGSTSAKNSKITSASAAKFDERAKALANGAKRSILQLATFFYKIFFQEYLKYSFIVCVVLGKLDFSVTYCMYFTHKG